MKLLRVQIVEFVDDSQPGWVRCTFDDIHGKQWSIVEKVPIVSDDDLTMSSPYPQLGTVPCQIAADRIGQHNMAIVSIDISSPVEIETEDGQTKFDVFQNQIVEK